MKAKDIEHLLVLLLEERSVPWVREQGLIRFRLLQNGAEWEVDFRCESGQAECFGRYPFSLSHRFAALRKCNEINLQTARGTMLLPPDGRPVFRTTADIGDVYDAEERLNRALDDNARAILRFWGSLSSLPYTDC